MYIWCISRRILAQPKRKTKDYNKIVEREAFQKTKILFLTSIGSIDGAILLIC